MVIENPNQQSTTGRLASGYLKTTGYTNMIGIAVSFVIGGLMIFGGLVLALLFWNFVPLLFAGVGLLIFLFAWFSRKASKKMREGKYYRVGRGWTNPR